MIGAQMPIADFFRRLLTVVRTPEAERREAIDRFIAHSNDVFCQIGPDLRVRYMSPACQAIFGRTADEMVGLTAAEMIEAEDLPLAYEAIQRGASGDGGAPVTVRIKRPDGKPLWVEASGRTVLDPTGRPLEIMLIIRDVTERKALEARLADDARTDALTGLANRRAFDDTLNREWARASRDQLVLSLILIDLDGFKAFNDLYGHVAGDGALRAAAQAVKAAVRRPGDLVARYGGEELAAILPGADAGGAAAVAETIRAAIEALALSHAASDWRVLTASVGVASATPGSSRLMKTAEQLIEAADAALYRAKGAGRNTVETARLLSAIDDSRAA